MRVPAKLECALPLMPMFGRAGVEFVPVDARKEQRMRVSLLSASWYEGQPTPALLDGARF